MATSITQQAYQNAVTLKDAGNVAGAWAALANAGDLYAAASYNVVSDPNSFYGRVVRAEWQVTGADLNKFNDVALRHLTQYLNIIGGSSSYTLPNTQQIEESYRTAVEWQHFSPLTAVDATFSRLSYSGLPLTLGWAGCQPIGGLCLEPERRVASNVFSDLNLADVGSTLGNVLNGLFSDFSGTIASYTNWAIQMQFRDTAAAMGVQFVYPEQPINVSNLTLGGMDTPTVSSDGVFNLYTYSNGVEYRELKPGFESPTGYDQNWTIPTDTGYRVISQDSVYGGTQRADYVNSSLTRQEYTALQPNGSIITDVWIIDPLSSRQIWESRSVETNYNGNRLNFSFDFDASGNPYVSSVNGINGQPPTDPEAAAAALNKAGITPDSLVSGGASGDTIQKVNGVVSTFDATHPTGLQTLTTALATTLDVLTLIKSIQSGEPLPILTSGLRVANDLRALNDLAPNYTLTGAANVGTSILSLMSLDAALKRGDALGAITAGAQTLSYGAKAYADFALANPELFPKSAVADSINGFFKEQLIDIPGLEGSTAIPMLNLVTSLAEGDEVGVAMAVLSMNPVTAPIATAYYVFEMISSIFGGSDAPPEAWGTAAAHWVGNDAVTSATGAYGGLETATATYDGFLSYLDQLVAEAQRVNPGMELGIVANRLPSITYRNYSGYQLTDTDPLTGEQNAPGMHFDLSGRPYDAPAGSEQASQSLSERFIRTALGRGAIAPLWEVETAALQTAAGDPMAGLTEEERAGRAGKLATPLTADDTTQTFRPVALDLNPSTGSGQAPDGVQTTGTNKTVAFNVDDTGYFKDTAWLNNNDAFLFLDRNLNGQMDGGRELFNNGVVALSERGLAGMRWIDSNYDGKITALDPVWDQLQVWQDANGDGVSYTDSNGDGKFDATEPSELKTLAELGITELNYAMGTFTHNGAVKQLASPDLAADAQGAATYTVNEGVILLTSQGEVSLFTTQIDDRSLLEANRDGVTGLEDVENIILGADLLANDTLAGLSGQDLSIAGVSNFTHGTGFLDENGNVHYTPEGDYFGEAGFEYSLQAATGLGVANDCEWRIAA